ncbi:hypothetical protein ABT158_39485 [Nonomuraea sp. NPDC001636]|uniref:hypothetical protein n=1 Tax=Nonomuraea sp. NPDC001636 TaxID=3154391 RepID=UPI0033327621
MTAFATSPEKIGRDLSEVIFLPPDNHPQLAGEPRPPASRRPGASPTPPTPPRWTGWPGSVEVAPLGYLPHLKSHKVAHINFEAQGWGQTTVSLDVKLKVHDPSGAAGVNIDRIRMAAHALRQHRGGYLDEAGPLLKSPLGTAV